MEHTDPPWTPHMPGISPTPSQPCTIHMPMNPLLSQSTWSISFKYSMWNIKVVATPLTSSRMFHYVTRSDLDIFNSFLLWYNMSDEVSPTWLTPVYLLFIQVAVTWLHLSLSYWTTSPLINDSLLVCCCDSVLGAYCSYSLLFYLGI